MFTKTKWIFDRNFLRKGDILFTRSPYVGTSIAKLTKGNFGHVMLYLGNTIIHADTKGVWSKNPQRLLMNEQSRLAAFRVKSEISEDHLKRIESFARSRVGSIYSIPEAFNSLRKRPEEIAQRFELHTQFCSRLVAQCYAEVGISLVADFDYCTPNEIAQSELVDEVRGCVVKASADEVKFNKTPDYNAELQRETYRWLSKVRLLTEKRNLELVDTQSEVGGMVLQNPNLDAEVCEYILDTKYMDFFDVDRRINPGRYDPKEMIKAFMSTPSFVESFYVERNINEHNLQRYEEERLKAVHNATSGLKYFALELELRTKLVEEMKMWRAALEIVARVAGINTGQ